jgi:type IV fimbrial biogenesis protein FimT
MNKHSGFTLIELMISIVVLAVVLALGIPSFQEFIKNNRLAGQTNDLVMAIQMARNEAVKRGTGSVICASGNQATCSESDDWTTGWIVFSDIDQEGDLELDANGDLVEDCEKDDCIVRTRGNVIKGSISGNGATRIQFRPDGLLDAGGAITLTLTADDCYQNQVRDVTVSAMGQTTITKQACP